MEKKNYENIEKWFPNLLNIIKETKIKKIEKKYQLLIDEVKQVWPEWSRFEKGNYYKIICHIFKVFKCLLFDQNYYNLDEQNQQLLLWAVLLHDCDKMEQPDIKAQDGRDPAHPFKSAYMALIYLRKINIIQISDLYMQIWDEVFKDAYMNSQYEKNVILCNIAALPKIVLFIENCINPAYKFWKDVLKLCLMHQIIPNSQFPPRTPLSNVKLELGLYFNKELLLLLEILWINDSLSYQNGNQMKRKEENFFTTEIQEQIKKIIKYLDF